MNIYAALQHVISMEGLPRNVKEAIHKFLNHGHDKRIPASAICCFRDGESWKALRRSADGPKGPAIGSGTTLEAAADNLLLHEEILQITHDRQESAPPATKQQIREACQSLLMDDAFMKRFCRVVEDNFLRRGF